MSKMITDDDKTRDHLIGDVLDALEVRFPQLCNVDFRWEVASMLAERYKRWMGVGYLTDLVVDYIEALAFLRNEP